MTTVQLGGGGEPTIRISAPKRERSEWLDHFLVEVDGAGLTACASVENPHSYFRELAAFSVAWPGTREWQSIEGELSVRSTCDPTGHVRIEFELRPGFGAPHAWRAVAAVEVSLGSVWRIASEIEEILTHGRP